MFQRWLGQFPALRSQSARPKSPPIEPEKDVDSSAPPHGSHDFLGVEPAWRIALHGSSVARQTIPAGGSSATLDRPVSSRNTVPIHRSCSRTFASRLDRAEPDGNRKFRVSPHRWPCTAQFNSHVDTILRVGRSAANAETPIFRIVIGGIVADRAPVCVWSTSHLWLWPLNR